MSVKTRQRGACAPCERLACGVRRDVCDERQTPEPVVDGAWSTTHTRSGSHTSPMHSPPAGTGCWQMSYVLHTSPALHGTPSQALLQYPPSPLGGRLNENEQPSARPPSSATAFIDVTWAPSVCDEASRVKIERRGVACRAVSQNACQGQPATSSRRACPDCAAPCRPLIGASA